MNMAVISSILLLSTFTLVRSTSDLGPMATLARCRVHCLEETLRETGGQCHEENSCELCWELCFNLMLSTRAYSTLCTQPKRCIGGCQVACTFKKNVHKVPENVTKWQFTSKPAVLDYPSTQKVAIGWQQPKPTASISGHPAFVYILFTKGESNSTSAQDWTQVDQMPYTDVVLRQDNLPRNPEFWLLAVNRNGTVADVKFNKTSLPIRGVLDIKKDSYKSYRGGGFSVNSPLRVNVSVVHDKLKGTISAVIEWQHPPIKLSERDSYTVHWFLDNCDAYEESPPCDVPPDHYAHTIMYKSGKKQSYTIEKLLFNALYKVKVELSSQYTGEVVFYTDFCGNVDDRTFTVCSDVVPAEHSTLSVLTPTQKTPVLNPLLYSINILSCQYDVNTKMIVAKFNWTVPFNQSYVTSYLVQASALNMSASFHTNIFPTKIPNITLTLYPYKDYEISVEAEYVNDLGQQESLRSSTLVFNTSWVESMPLTLSSQSYYLVKNDKSKFSDAMVIGVALILIVTLIALIVLFIYKKRHSFKANIIPKTAVAKSNSYKSNVGCKVDYSNQLLVMSDEWELDPRLLKFSSPIGQGAFGKVVTGYYGNEKVAIKLVRDSAPLSYKEDLLAEINLMKRLGSHPNIVSMTGACTLSEPIALVMEYVPYGNLQTFLKKCRLEGEFQRPIGRPSEVIYSLMDSSGGIDSGVITPADMLSFTRQVAMAMEYLSAKKYVHRDLAARNVLLGYDKIVKLCDFGLSRDIYNDNQYHKVTSGKLPLKWMAIESLRDRIFTTQSDVWSFGILMWEIITMGGSPYPNIALADLYYVLANGYRMEKPSNCSDELYIIMRQCWVETPTDRPSFTDLRVQIELLLSRDRDYLELDNIDVPLSTSESSSVPKSEDSDTQSLISDGITQHRMTTVPMPLQHTSRNIANMMKARVSGSGIMGASTSGSASSAATEPFDTPVTVVSIEGKSSKERLIGKHSDVDQ